MDDLNNKLKKILDKHDLEEGQKELLIDQIRQCFAKETKLRTGKDWYDRFIKELDTKPLLVNQRVFLPDVTEAAKKASGIS